MFVSILDLSYTVTEICNITYIYLYIPIYRLASSFNNYDNLCYRIVVMRCQCWPIRSELLSENVCSRIKQDVTQYCQLSLGLNQSCLSLTTYSVGLH